MSLVVMQNNAQHDVSTAGGQKLHDSFHSFDPPADPLVVIIESERFTISYSCDQLVDDHKATESVVTKHNFE